MVSVDCGVDFLPCFEHLRRGDPACGNALTLAWSVRNHECSMCVYPDLHAYMLISVYARVATYSARPSPRQRNGFLFSCGALVAFLSILPVGNALKKQHCPEILWEALCLDGRRNPTTHLQHSRRNLLSKQWPPNAAQRERHFLQNRNLSCIYTYIYIYIHTYVYIYTYIYIYTTPG